MKRMDDCSELGTGQVCTLFTSINTLLQDVL